MAINFLSAAAAPTKGKKAKADTKARVLTDDLLNMASLDAVKKSIETLQETFGQNIKRQMSDYFLKTGGLLEKRPENYKGFEDTAEASLELRKRDARSPLDENQQQLLSSNNIDMDTVTVYSLNNEVLTPQVMALVEKALNSVPGIPPNLFNVSQKVVVADNALHQIFKVKNKKGDFDEPKARSLLDVVGTMAIKPQVKEDFEVTLERVTDLLKP